jgi:hypothetical protein
MTSPACRRATAAEGRQRRAAGCALLLFGLPGTSFTYQGQELGLEEVDLPDEARQDPVFLHTNGARKGATAAASRSLDGGATNIRVHRRRALAADATDWGAVSVEAQEHAGAMLELFRSALRLRPRGRRASRGVRARRDDDLRAREPRLRRQLRHPELQLPEGEILLASEPGITTSLPRTPQPGSREELDNEDVTRNLGVRQHGDQVQPGGYKPELAGQTTTDRSGRRSQASAT